MEGMAAGVARPRVVLVEPRVPGNLGFTARALANFGLDDWWAVRGPGWRGSEAERTGAPARPVLEALRETDSLSEAVADRTHLVGWTARGGGRRRLVPAHEVGEVARSWGPGARVAFLFGPEDRGLTNLQCEQCTVLATLPTPPGALASFNLSHAVALALQAWFLPEAPAWSSEAAAAGGATGLPGPALADVEEKIRLALEAHAVIRDSGFRDPSGEEVRGALRRILAQPLERRDLRTLQRILRHVEWLRSGAEERRKSPR